MHNKISACVITKNEQRALERCLKSLKFADEIIVIDAFSTDQTIEIAKKYTNNVFTHQWQGFAQQRNYGLEKCTGEWVLFIDADEEVSPQLVEKLKTIAHQKLEQNPNCYSIQRVEYFLGKELHYGPGNPSYQWRFFKRKGVHYVGEVHEYPQFDGAIGKISEPILHWPDLGVEKFIQKMNHYTTIEAIDRFAQGHRTTLLHAIGTFFSTFLKNGIRYKGFCNGKEGLILITLEAVSRVVRHFKLWILWQVYEEKIKFDLGFSLPRPGSVTAPKTSDLERPKWNADSTQ